MTIQKWNVSDRHLAPVHHPQGSQLLKRNLEVEHLLSVASVNLGLNCLSRPSRSRSATLGNLYCSPAGVVWRLSVWHSKFPSATPISVVAIQIFPSVFYIFFFFFFCMLSSILETCWPSILPSTLIVVMKRLERLFFCP